MDTKELRKIAEYLTQVAESDVPSLLDASDAINMIKQAAAKVNPDEIADAEKAIKAYARRRGTFSALAGLGLGAGGTYYLTRRHYKKRIGTLERTLPDYTTPRELSIMKNTAQEAYIAGYNKAVDDISRQLRASSNTRKRGEMAPSEKFRRILLKTAEDLTAAAERLDELETENRKLSNQNKLMKAAEAMVDQGMASDTEQALSMLDDALQSGSDPDAIIKLLKSKNNDIETL